MLDSGWFGMRYWQGPGRKGHALSDDSGWVGDSTSILVVREFCFVSQQKGVMQAQCMTGSPYLTDSLIIASVTDKNVL